MPAVQQGAAQLARLSSGRVILASTCQQTEDSFCSVQGSWMPGVMGSAAAAIPCPCLMHHASCSDQRTRGKAPHHEVWSLGQAAGRTMLLYMEHASPLTSWSAHFCGLPPGRPSCAALNPPRPAKQDIWLLKLTFFEQD